MTGFIYHPRHVEGRIQRLARQFPVVLVGGARQTGKSTLLRHLFPDVRTIVFDPVQDVGSARADPELFLRLNPPPLVLDEIQHAPALSAGIKRIVDERPDQRGLYVFTGSQQFAVMRGVQESLAGRAGVVDLLPMSRAEVDGRPSPGLLAHLLDAPDAAELVVALEARGPDPGSPGNLFERLFRGGYPGLLTVDTADAPEWFDAYLRTYVERDVRLLREVQDPHEFTRFARLVAALTAQELNASHLGREIGIAGRSARAWLDVLVGSYQVMLLDAWSGNTVKRVSGRPKLHVVDTGLAAHLLSVSSPSALGSHPALGALFESHVVLDLVKQAQGLATRPRFWHWRTAGGAEVDLVVERDGVLHLVEVRLKAHPSRRDTSGLQAFAATYPDARLGRRVVVHGGTSLHRLDEDTVAVPVGYL